MPSRLISESIWTSPTLAKLSPMAELHFYKLLPLPDDHGCCQLTSSVVKGRLYPLKPEITEKMIEKWHKELEESDIIRIWEENERLYGYFPTWSKHQRVRSLHLRRTPEPPASVVTRCQPPSSDDARCHSHHNPNLNPNQNPDPNLEGGKKKKPKPPLSKIPENFEITDDLKAWASTKNLGLISLEAETEKFLNYCRAHGKKYVDVVAAWRNWMIRANEYAASRPQPPPVKPEADMTSEERYEKWKIEQAQEAEEKKRRDAQWEIDNAEELAQIKRDGVDLSWLNR